MTYVETLTLLPPDEVMSPDLNNGYIEELELIPNGFKYIYNNCPGFLSATDKTDSIEIHCRRHGWRVNLYKALLIVSSMVNLHFGSNVLCKHFSKENTSNTLK